MENAFSLRCFVNLSSFKEEDVKYEINWNGIFHY